MDALKPTYANGRLAKVGDIVVGPFFNGGIGLACTSLVTWVSEHVAKPFKKDEYPDFDIQSMSLHENKCKSVEHSAVNFILLSDVMAAIASIPISNESSFSIPSKAQDRS